MNIYFVIGADGQLGTDVCIEIEKKHLPLVKITHQSLDIRDIIKVYNFFQSYNLDQNDVIINCAALTNVDNCEKTPNDTFNTNTLGVQNIINMIKYRCSNTKLVQISTDFIFDGNTDKPYIGTDKANPINVYGRSKWMAEKLITAQLSNYLIVRTSGLFGGLKKNHTNFVNKFYQLYNKAGYFLLYKNTTRSIAYTVDVASALIDKLVIINEPDYQYSKEECVHLINSGISTLYEQYYKLGQLLGLNNIKITDSPEYNTTALRPKYSVLSPWRANILPTWDNALERYITTLNLI